MSHHGHGPFGDKQARQEAESIRELLERKVAQAEALPDQPNLDASSTFRRRQATMRELLDTAGFVGATGEFPHGKLTSGDEGAIQFAIGIEDGRVVVDFGTSVHWLGMTPQQAAEFASTLLKKAREAGRKNGETVTFVF